MSAKVGVALVGHGHTASHLLAAARKIVDAPTLADIAAVDAGEGETPELSRRLCDVLDAIDEGRGVVVLVDLLGASPFQCAQRQARGRATAVVSGLNLAMLLKLASLDRGDLKPAEIAEACADSGKRAVRVCD